MDVIVANQLDTFCMCTCEYATCCDFGVHDRGGTDNNREILRASSFGVPVIVMPLSPACQQR